MTQGCHYRPSLQKVYLCLALRKDSKALKLFIVYVDYS